MAKIVSNKRQLDKLVSLMEENQDIASGVCRKAQAARRWQEMALELNSLGPPLRTWDKWLRVWTDLKFKRKRRLTHNRGEFNKTDGGPKNLQNVHVQEESSIVSGFMSAGTCSNTPSMESGLPTKEEFEKTLLSERPTSTPVDSKFKLIEVDSPPNETESSQNRPDNDPEKNKDLGSKKRSHREENRMRLLEEQTKAQREFYASMRSDFKDIKKIIKNIENYQLKTYYLQKDVLKIKQEKLELYKDEVENKRNLRIEKLKLKAKILELEKNPVRIKTE